jgi:hypothetical protein
LTSYGEDQRLRVVEPLPFALAGEGTHALTNVLKISHKRIRPPRSNPCRKGRRTSRVVVAARQASHRLHHHPGTCPHPHESIRAARGSFSWCCYASRRLVFSRCSSRTAPLSR